MDIHKLAECLRPWMQTDTWHKDHPNDQKRFHQALKAAFDALGTPIFAEHFVEAMTVNAKAQGLTGEFYTQTIASFASKGDAISEYLKNIPA